MDTRMSPPHHGEDPYRWMILAIMAVLFFITSAAQFQLAGVAGGLASSLRLDPMQFAMCLFAPYLMNFVFGIPIGMTADRFGTRAVGSVLLVVSSAGLIGRAYAATGFVSLLAWMLLFGFSMAFANALGPKIVRTWFKPEQVPLALGLLIACAGLGVGVGEATAPLMTSLAGAFTLAWVLFAATTAWFLFGFRTKPAGQSDPPPQRVLEFVGIAAHNRHVWVAGSAALFLFAALAGAAGNLPGALAQLQNVTPAEAGLVGLPFGFGGALGGFFVPLILQRRRGIRVWLGSSTAVGAALVIAALVVPFGPMTWICAIVGAFLTSGTLTLIVALPVMLREIGTTYGGSAGGIVSLLQTGGGFFVPTFAIALIAGSSPMATFAVIFALYVISALLVLALPERGFHHAAPEWAGAINPS